MVSLDTKAVGTIAGVTLISAFLIFKFEWLFTTHEFGWHIVLLWIPYLTLHALVSTVGCVLLDAASRRWLLGSLIRLLGK